MGGTDRDVCVSNKEEGLVPVGQGGSKAVRGEVREDKIDPAGTAGLQTIEEDEDSKSFLDNLNKLNRVTSTKERRTSEIFNAQTNGKKTFCCSTQHSSSKES